MENYGKSRYFKFKITNPNKSASDKKAGFIDSMPSQEYVDFDPELGTLEEYTAKGLGYIRWLNLSLALSNFGIFRLEVDSLDGATSIETPNSIEFTIGYEQTDAMYLKIGDTVYHDIDVLKYLTAYVMSNNYSSFVHVYDPSRDDFGKNPSLERVGLVDKFLTAEKLCDKIDDAYPFISIVEVDGLDGDETIKF